MDNCEGMFVKDIEDRYWRLHYFIAAPVRSIAKGEKFILFAFAKQLLPCLNNQPQPPLQPPTATTNLVSQMNTLFQSKHTIPIQFQEFYVTNELFCFPAHLISKEIEVVHNCTPECFKKDFTLMKKKVADSFCRWEKRTLLHTSNSWMINIVHD